MFRVPGKEPPGGKGGSLACVAVKREPMNMPRKKNNATTGASQSRDWTSVPGPEFVPFCRNFRAELEPVIFFASTPSSSVLGKRIWV